jgi:hypothetical protein
LNGKEPANKSIRPDTSGDRTDERSTSRSALLRVAGIGAAGAVIGGVVARDGEAANNDPLLVGNASNAASATTALTASGTANTPGLQVEALDYVAGVEATAIFGVAGFGLSGGFFSGTDAAISLAPASAPGPPSNIAFKGDMSVDSNGALWICIADGEPGTWIRLSSVNLLQAPQRLIDTRFGGGGPFAPGETRTYNVGGVVNGIPAHANGILGIISVVNTTVDASGVGFVVAYPKGTAQPATATGTWFGNNQILATGFSVGLGGAPPGISVFCHRQTDVVIDITGYVA